MVTMASNKQKKRKCSPLQSGSLSRRFFAYLIDWYAGALVGAIPVSMLASQLTGDMTNQNLIDLPSPYGLVAGALSLVLAFAYFVLVPAFVWPGQTPAKRMMGLRIATLDGGTPTFGQLVVRQVIGLFVIDGALVSASTIWHQMLSIVTGINFVTPLMYVGFAVTLASVVLILMRKDRRCIHDLIAGTRVVKAEQELVKETSTID